MRITSETAQQNVFVNQTAANADKPAQAKDKTLDAQTMQGDVVDISDEGVRRSKASQTAKAANSQGANGEGNNASENEGNVASESGTASGKVSAAKLEEQLNTKKSEVKRKQEKLDTLKRQAEDDSTKDGEAKKLQGEIDRLKKEEKQLKSEMNR